jgi:diaminopimelate decarboxylase
MALRPRWLRRRTGTAPDPALWGLERRDGRLHIDGQDLVALADRFGTPLHVASARVLEMRCRELQGAFSDYPAPVRVCYSYKTNRIAGILRVLHGAGCGAEVVDEYELQLARQLEVAAEHVVLNGSNKSDRELELAVEQGVGLIVADGMEEIRRLDELGAAAGRRVSVALRVCPDIRPRGMNVSSITGSRQTHFGFDLRSGEASRAVREAVTRRNLRLRGMMAHIGSGIHDLGSIARSVERLLDLQLEARRVGAAPDLLDVGGGLGTRRSREFTTWELLRYLALGRLPRPPHPAPEDLVVRYGAALTEAVTAGCRRRGLEVPALVLEPGRALVSDAQVLALRVGAVRERPGVGRFAVTDGGAMTVSMMFLSEYHSVLLANRDAPLDGETNVFGRLPSPMDVVYRGAPLPRLEVNDLLAVMDAGAYFTATETSFGGARPAVVLIEDGEPHLIRRRESYADRIALDSEIGVPEGEDHAPEA